MKPLKPGEEFMRLTRYAHALPSDQQTGVPQPPLNRRHPLAGRSLPLPPAGEGAPGMLDIHSLISSRESVREYADASLSRAQLSWLLWCSQGVKETMGDGYATLRTVPSAGARHALETYLVINRIEGLVPGLYQFLPPEHAIAPVLVEEGVAHRFAVACLGQPMLVTAAVSFVWTAVPYRMTWRYGQRGYRYMHLDAGHACQNLYLAAEAVGCGCCAIAAFDDDRMADILRIDPAEEFVIYLATVGRKEETCRNT